MINSKISSPNYRAGIPISGNFTAPNDGILVVCVMGGTRYVKGSINGQTIINTSTQGSSNYTEITTIYPLRKGNSVTFTRFENPNICIFYPYS